MGISDGVIYWNHILKWYHDALGWDKDDVLEYTMQLFRLQAGPTRVEHIDIELMQVAAQVGLIDIEIDESHVYLLREPDERLLDITQDHRMN